MTGGPLIAALLPARPVLHAAPVSSDDGAPVTVPRVPAREAAEDELSRPAYQQDQPGLLQCLLEWVWDRVSDLLGTAATATPGGWVGLTVIAVLLLLLIVALRLRLGRLRSAEPASDGALFPDGPRSAADHRAAAEAHATAGRWSEALQERMRAIVRALEERALLDPRPGRTADEAAAEAGRSLPGHASALRSAAHAFDEVTYAGRPADETAYGHVRSLDQDLQRTRPRLTVPGDDNPHGDGHRTSSRSTHATASTPDGGGR